MQLGHLIISILETIFFLVSELLVCGIFFSLPGNYKLIRMIIKFSEKLHIIPNELYSHLPTFWLKRTKGLKKHMTYPLKVKI